MLPVMSGTYTCKAKPPKYKPVKSNHPESENMVSGPLMSPAVATTGHREKSKNMPSIEDKSHDGDPFHYAVI